MVSSLSGYLMDSSSQKKPRLKGLCWGVRIKNGSPTVKVKTETIIINNYIQLHPLAQSVIWLCNSSNTQSHKLLQSSLGKPEGDTQPVRAWPPPKQAKHVPTCPAHRCFTYLSFLSTPHAMCSFSEYYKSEPRQEKWPEAKLMLVIQRRALFQVESLRSSCLRVKWVNTKVQILCQSLSVWNYTDGCFLNVRLWRRLMGCVWYDKPKCPLLYQTRSCKLTTERGREKNDHGKNDTYKPTENV